MNTLVTRAAALAALLGFGSLGAAQTVQPPSAQPSTRPSPAQPQAALPVVTLHPDPLRPEPPQVQHDNGVAWVTGGVSIPGRQRTIEAASGMNLQLVFSRMPDAIHLAGVDVQIADRDGRAVLAVDDADPLLFAQLPAGVYQVTATFGGEPIERRVMVPGKGLHTEFIDWRDGGGDAGNAPK